MHLRFSPIVFLFVAVLIWGCGEDNSVEDGDMPIYDGDVPTDGDTSDGDGDDGPDGDDPQPDGDKPQDGDFDFELNPSDTDPIDWEFPDVDLEPFLDGDQDDVHTDGDVADGDTDGDQTDGDAPDPTSCHFEYPFVYDPIDERRAASAKQAPTRRADSAGPDVIAHPEPAPEGYVYGTTKGAKFPEVVLPDYTDDMPVFERGAEWTEPTRCYEHDGHAYRLSETQAYNLYAQIVTRSLWHAVDTTPGQRTVIGIRGAYPGSLDWHGNLPNRFNDTLALIWIDASGTKHAREWHAHTDTGPVDFGYHSSSSLAPNRAYPYDYGWHRGYSALSIGLWEYPVRDDTNHNGHWDNDRNGWFPPYAGEDHDRMGSAHNIHTGPSWAPLWTAPVDNLSAGCQVIPGMANWLTFIEAVWTEEGDELTYYLIDARDISPAVFSPCETRDGTHGCPWEIRQFPYTHSASTADSNENWHVAYNCSEADESGPERVYVTNIRAAGTLIAQVTVDDESIDPDVHILTGDDANACLARGHIETQAAVVPGRYVIIVDTWVNAEGQQLAGDYTLSVGFVEE